MFLHGKQGVIGILTNIRIFSNFCPGSEQIQILICQIRGSSISDLVTLKFKAPPLFVKGDTSFTKK